MAKWNQLIVTSPYDQRRGGDATQAFCEFWVASVAGRKIDQHLSSLPLSFKLLAVAQILLCVAGVPCNSDGFYFGEDSLVESVPINVN